MRKKGERGASELEGAILSQVFHRGAQTAFRVRRSFAESPSLEWRGSAGAVYGATKALERRGWVAGAATGDGRATRLLTVTAAGRKAMLAWACDPVRATSPGVDPFRMRAGIWLQLDEKTRKTVLAAVRRELEASVAFLRGYSREGDTIELASVDLAFRVQRVRLAWIASLGSSDRRRGTRRT